MKHLAVEDYLADIYRLQSKGELPSTGTVAGSQGVAPATATAMFKRLAREGLVSYKEYEGVGLTKSGRQAALAVLRRHRLIERFLTDLLKIPWDRVDGYADQMEHGFPDEVVDALENLLGSPSSCPHGYPIPGRNGQVPNLSLRPLVQLPPGAQAVVRQVDEHVPGLLAYLERLGIVPGTALAVGEVNPIDGTMVIEAAGNRTVVGPPIARSIFVEIPSRPEKQKL